MAQTAKHRVRGSKNKKKAWKKCDISEVEEYLEEKRFDERIGGAVSERSDSNLFILQTSPEDVSLEVGKKVKFPLKCHSNIGAFTKVEVPIIINKEPYSKKIKASQTKADIRRRKRALSRKVQPKEEKDVLTADFYVSEVKDLWAEEEKPDSEIQDLVLFNNEMTRNRRPNVPRHRYQKPSLLPAVEVPHPGSSYNPSFEDHQDLLSEAVEIEQVKEREELHLKRVLTDMFPTKENAPTTESILEEMSQGLFDEEQEDVTDQPLSQCRNPPVSRDDRVTKSRKRKIKERKEQERLKKAVKLRKKQLNQVYRLRSIKSEIKKFDVISQARQDNRIQRKIDKMYKPIRLSKHKYEAPDLEVALSGELCESLRTLKAEGNLLEDRYKSFQRRNLIEPRILQKRKRRYKLKKQVKRNHRNFE